jgi:protein subunit release factor A
MKLVLEIRAAEGGTDAKLLVKEQAGIYLNFAKRVGLAVRELDCGLG